MKKTILSLLIVFSFSKTFSQNCGFSLLTYSPISGVVSDPFTGDFNNDGKSDILSHANGTLTVYLQTINNNFSLATTITSNSNLIFGCADFNNDGKIDAVSQSHVFLGQGNGTFTEAALTQTIYNIYSNVESAKMVIADFNNDGNKDILTPGFANSSIYFGTGTGQFNAPVTYTAFSNYSSDVGLINNDGNVDVAFAQGTLMAVYHGNGSGSFTLSSNSPSLVSNPNAGFTKVLDLNNDNKSDIVQIPNHIWNGTNTVSVQAYLSNTNNTFYSPASSSINIGQPYNYCVIGDMNSDNYPDLVSLSMSSNNGSAPQNMSVTINFNDGLGVFNASKTFTFFNYGRIAKMNTGDYNNDGTRDLAIQTLSCSVPSLYILLSNPNCAWPGDANSNGIANNIDILELGLQFNQTGPARATQNNTWIDQSFSAWTGSVSTGKNKGHADCNGNGVVNLNDTLAVYLNYGFTHFKPSQEQVVNPDITIVPDQSAVLKNTWGTASIFLGDASNTINNIHGVAFTASFDNSIIETDSVYIEYVPSFINSNNMHFRKRVFANGVLYTATTHTNQVNANGNGKIAILHYKVKPTLANDAVLNLGIANANKLSATGVLSSLTSGTGTLNAVTVPNGIRENNLGQYISVYPNPSNGSLTIKQLVKENSAKEIIIYNNLGQVVFTKKLNTLVETIDTNLAKGIYFYSLNNDKQQILKSKLIIE